MILKHRDRVWGAVVGAAFCALFAFHAAPAFAWTVSSDGNHLSVVRSVDDSMPLSAVRVYSDYLGTDPFDAVQSADRPEFYSSSREFVPLSDVSSFECTVTPGVHLVEVESYGEVSDHVVCVAAFRPSVSSTVTVEGPVDVRDLGGLSSEAVAAVGVAVVISAGVALGMRFGVRNG